MEKKEMLYGGEAGKIYTTEDPDVLIVLYRGDAIAFNGPKKGTIIGKGAINSHTVNSVFKELGEKGVPIHLAGKLNDRETAVRRMEIVPLEAIIRNCSAGSLAKKMGIEEDIKFKCPILKLSYKNDDLDDPFINSYCALTPGLTIQEEIDDIAGHTFKINEVLQEYPGGLSINLIDFKIEFGHYHGKVILIGEISPDTCHLWDKDTHEKLDKDRLRGDLDNVEDVYGEAFRRLDIQ